jgi:adenylate kinase family enzyme
MLITGPIGSSKSTLTNLMKVLASDPRRMFGIDTSACLENSRRNGTWAGQKLRKVTGDQKKGILLEAKPVFHSMMENLHWLLKQSLTPAGAIVAGSPRSIEEVELLLEARENQLLDFRALFIECTEDEISAGVQARIDSGEMRLDDGPDEIKTRCSEYQKKTIPSVNALPPELLARTARSKPLLERLADLVLHMDVDAKLQGIWLDRLAIGSGHPIHDEIKKMSPMEQNLKILKLKKSQSQRSNHLPNDQKNLQ